MRDKPRSRVRASRARSDSGGQRYNGLAVHIKDVEEVLAGRDALVDATDRLQHHNQIAASNSGISVSVPTAVLNFNDDGCEIGGVLVDHWVSFVGVLIMSQDFHARQT